MNDLEICKRIAEIEGESVVVFDDFCIIDELLHTLNSIRQCDDDSFMCALISTQYNPLTDDGLCFRLMDKYNVLREGTGTVFYRCVIANYGNGPEYYRATAETLNKAVCLTIIEANKNEN